MKNLDNLVPATYTPIERGSVAAAVELTERLVKLEIPAFIISKAGLSVAEATKRTKVAATLRSHGYDGDVRDRVDFGSVARGILPEDHTEMPIPVGDEWAEIGVTPLHSDLSSGGRGQQYSMNLTLVGNSEFRFHENRVPEERMDEQWDLLDSQVGNLLWYGLADPTLISPEGYKANLEAEDLLVFDPSYAHMVRGLTNPRYAEATFFEKCA